MSRLGNLLSLLRARVLPFWEAAVYLATVSFYSVWEIVHRGTYQYAQNIYAISDADEWRYTACSRLVNHGYSLFTQIFSAQPPLLFASLAAGMRLVGDSITGARSVEIVFGLLGLVCTVWCARTIAGPVAGAAAALLLVLSPGFLVYSHTVEAEGPMMALATLSLALALCYLRTGREVLLIGGGLALGGAVLMKLFAAEMLLPVLCALLLCRPAGRRLDRAVVLYCVAAFFPIGLDFALLHPGEQWAQVVRLHEKAANLHLPGLTPPLELLGQFLTVDLGLSLAALAGICLLLWARWREGVVMAAWVLGNVVMLLTFRPLFQHHAAILLTGLAVSGGVAAGIAMTERHRHTVLGLTAIAAVAYVLLLPRIVHDDRHLLYPSSDTTVASLVAFVQRESSPHDLIATDDLRVADVAGRLVSPPLCDPSTVRLQAGFLTPAVLIHGIAGYHVRLVLPSFGIFRQVPGFMTWLERHYMRVGAPGGTVAYVAATP